MNPELPKLEAKREELEARLAAARIKGDLRAVDITSVLLCQCHEKISTARAGGVARLANNPPITTGRK